MKSPVHGTALFCEDIRDEVGGSTSLIGIMPDNIVVAKIPSKLPKIAVYSRIILPVDYLANDISIWLKYPNGQEVRIGNFEADFVKETCEEARSEGNLVAGLIAQAQTTAFAINEEGRIFFVLRYGDQEDLIGSVNFSVAGDEQEEIASNSTVPESSAFLAYTGEAKAQRADGAPEDKDPS